MLHDAAIEIRDVERAIHARATPHWTKSFVSRCQKRLWRIGVHCARDAIFLHKIKSLHKVARHFTHECLRRSVRECWPFVNVCATRASETGETTILQQTFLICTIHARREVTRRDTHIVCCAVWNTFEALQIWLPRCVHARHKVNKQWIRVGRAIHATERILRYSPLTVRCLWNEVECAFRIWANTEGLLRDQE